MGTGDSYVHERKYWTGYCDTHQSPFLAVALRKRPHPPDYVLGITSAGKSLGFALSLLVLGSGCSDDEIPVVPPTPTGHAISGVSSSYRVSLNGPTQSTATADNAGNYVFRGLADA